MFSVILCVNKDQEFLNDAIFSVLNQTYSDFEFIIVANNCEDELFNKLLGFEDPRIRLFRTAIGQLSFNLNYAINVAVGDYIVRIDADDVCMPDRLEMCSEFIGSDYDVVAFSCHYINDLGETIGGRNLANEKIENIFYRNPIVHPAVMFKRDSIVRAGGYLGGFQSEDYDLWIRLYNKGCRFYFSDKVAIEYRIHDSQTKGSLLPYCEVSGYFIREFLLSLKFKYLFSFFVSVFKRFKR
ncbi:glycosyltransferase [Vibrio fluvialis]|uniref:glycosyltransferase n=1 Tax=Vibrio fluvialis TaxID=676 RepID=UPI0028DD5FF0|nr:glycosyltransferase [Vibrio fluvialis]MDT8869696.1 glycosyltransferase [Vibrio fluvialis]MDT8877466.1 glycosyltransferase [Vibrio fluvialis]